MASVRKPPTPGPSTGAPDPNNELAPRKLIRPSLSDVRREPSAPRGVRKGAPPDQTNAESFYYLKQMQARTPIVVRLVDGEELRGWIEWYDKDALKLNRENAPNLLLQKQRHQVPLQGGGGAPVPAAEGARGARYLPTETSGGSAPPGASSR